MRQLQGLQLCPHVCCLMFGATLPSLQVARFCIDRAEAVADDSPECRHPATLRMLWQVLGLLCAHRGQLQSPPSALLAEGISDKKPGGVVHCNCGKQ